MAKIHTLSIKNFRGIKDFKQVFGRTSFICLIGRGDSGKSTILEAISYVLSPSWNLSLYDTDFYNCVVNEPIYIEVILTELPDKLLREDKYGLYVQGLDSTGNITNEIEETDEPVLTIKLEVQKDLEPKWSVTNGVHEAPISAFDRGLLNTFMLSDFMDRHFSWTKGGPLFSLLKRNSEDGIEEDNTIIDALREAKLQIDKGAFSQFEKVSDIVKSKALEYGVDISSISTTVDVRDMSIKEGKVSLHDDKVPFRLKGKGSKRLISAAIQTALAENGGIVLIDEFEQGLEPDRVQHLANHLKKNNKGQIFITTHSRDVIVQLSTEDLFLKRENDASLTAFNPVLQGCIRKNPEAFFAKKVLVCEGATEIGICVALNNYRIEQGKANAAFKGVRFTDGSGNRLLNYCNGFSQSKFTLCLFCDSDSQDINKEKEGLKKAGVTIVDWNNGACLETAIINHIPYKLLEEVMNLAAMFKMEAASINEEDAKKAIWDAIQSRFGTGCPAELSPGNDSGKLREAIGLAAKKNEWFKSQTKGEMLGNLLFKHYTTIGTNELTQSLEALSNWIENA